MRIIQKAAFEVRTIKSKVCRNALGWAPQTSFFFKKNLEGLRKQSVSEVLDLSLHI